MIKELYHEIILDHNKNPRNHCALEDASHEITGHNRLCGDHIVLYADINNNRIENIGFTGQGCAISTASASLMTETIKGKDVEEALVVFSKVKQLLTGDQKVDDIGKLAALAGVKNFPARVKCAMLPWRSLEALLTSKKQKVSTE